MVRDNQINAQLPRHPRRLHRRHAAIHRHDHLRPPTPVRRQLPDRIRVQPIPLLQPMRHIRPHIRVRRDVLADVVQDRRRRHPIHVIVAVDHDPLARSQRRHYPLGRKVQIGYQRWVVQLAQFRIEEHACVRRVGNAAHAEQAGGQRRCSRRNKRQRITRPRRKFPLPVQPKRPSRSQSLHRF